MNDQTIKVHIKKICGQDRIYPKCDKSRTFVEMLGGKTITTHALQCIKKLGYKIMATKEKQPQKRSDE